ncbi:MAG: hypothetical protein ACRCX2_19475 [Paraclostridium sp.]
MENKLSRDVICLVELLNDKLEHITKCEESCPYSNGCNILIKENGVSLCGSIDKVILNK